MQTKFENIAIVQVDISKLKSSEYNPRLANEKECKDLKTSIEHFGMVDPLIVNSAEERKNIVIGGHFRLRMAKEIGYEKLPVVYVNVPDIKKEKELCLRLNKNSGSWNFDLLSGFDEKLLKDIGFTDFDLGIAGFDQEEEQKSGRLEYYHKEIECPFCHKKFKRKVNDV